MRKVFAAWFVVAGAVALAAGNARAASIVMPRAGQVGVGIQGNFGTLFETGQLGQEFGSGFGLGVRLRYRMRYERAIGLSFDQQTLKARVPGMPEGAFIGHRDPIDALLTRDRLVMTTTGLDLYQMFDTRERTVKWLSVGAGIVQVSARLSDGETQFPVGNDGTFLSAGAGLERFFYRSWAYDLSARYQAEFYGSSVNHDLQATAGLIFYAAY
jgi:hypothetical protein